MEYLTTIWKKCVIVVTDHGSSMNVIKPEEADISMPLSTAVQFARKLPENDPRKQLMDIAIQVALKQGIIQPSDLDNPSP